MARWCIEDNGVRDTSFVETNGFQMATVRTDSLPRFPALT